MKTKKFLMLLAAVLLSCASTMAQNSPLKGDVNGDGTVDVADIVAILDIMKNGTKELQSIKWASTTAVNGTTGTTPSLGDITLTYNDGTTGTVAYNASGVTLFTDAAGNTPFSNANPGTFNVWAKYCGMMTANSKQVTLSTPVPATITSYYYYAGWTLPTESNVDIIINETYPAESGSTTINPAGKKTTSKSIMDYTSNTLHNANAKATYYVLVPTGHAIYDPLDNNVVEDFFTSKGNITIGNQTHTIYAYNGTSRNIGAIIIK